MECNDDKYFYIEYEEGYIDFKAFKFNNDPTGDLWEQYGVTYDNCYEYSYFTDNGKDRNRELIENEIDYIIYKRTYLKGEKVGQSYYVKLIIESNGSLYSSVSELGASLVDGDFGPVQFYEYYIPATDERKKTYEELVLGTYTICPESSIYFENGTCKCSNGIGLGDKQVIIGVKYNVVNDFTIVDQIAAGNFNLCTTFVNNMDKLFSFNNSFNSDIGFWDTSNVTDMGNMFNAAISFNQDIGGWDTSSVADMFGAFSLATAFNQNIGNWDTSKVTDMVNMFDIATAFNQDLSGWCVTNITSEPYDFAVNSALTNANKPVWGTCP